MPGSPGGYDPGMTENQQPAQTEVPVEQPAKETTTTEVDATPETGDVDTQDGAATE